MQAWFSEHKLITYLIILGFTIYIFNSVFRPSAKRLPILKEVLVYLLMAFGSFILMIMQVDKLPIIQCMAIAVLMMMMLRGRQLYDKWKKGRGGPSSAESRGAENGQ
ncbi:YlaH-like family protein [Paenibacillus sp. PL2-23]|uniref:YlaH-like family protein n=1 Tax=Paenibacillus sp. PL2-23 TaxID=2100729 RepID=UPI0030F9406C